MAASKPRIWVDADSFPTKARDFLLQAAARKAIPVTYVANHDIPFSTSSPLFTMELCPATPGAADDRIVESCVEGDIVLTRDIPLAARLVEKGICVANDRGTVFDRQSVTRRLKERELSMQMEVLGLHSGYRSEGYGAKELGAFKSSLLSLLSTRIP